MDVMTVKAAAARRVLAREKPAEFRLAARTHGGQDSRVQTGGGPGEFADPVTAAEWLDDRLARAAIRDDDPASEVLCAIAEAARDGERTARAAVGAAGQLDEHAQWRLFMTLQAWHSHDAHPQAQPLMRAILQEWARQGLAVTLPEPVEVPVRTLNQADLDQVDALRRKARGW
jgi:hypothetical protein